MSENLLLTNHDRAEIGGDAPWLNDRELVATNDPSPRGGGESGVVTTEHTINDALASVLRHGRQAWRASGIVRSENTGLLKSSAGLQPDILVLEPHVSPVVIETEVLPAITVEPEARARLGESIKATGRTILSSIAVRLPKRLREIQGPQLQVELSAATDLEMALFTGKSPANASRWPHNQWITGTVSDLSFLTQSATVPPEVVDVAADELTAGIREAAGLFAEVAISHKGATKKSAKN
jgi:hypothetical protein